MKTPVYYKYFVQVKKIKAGMKKEHLYIGKLDQR